AWWSSRWRTTVPASRWSSGIDCSGCSRGSTRAKGSKGAVSVWPWSSDWWRAAAAVSSSTPPRAAGRPSGSPGPGARRPEGSRRTPSPCGRTERDVPTILIVDDDEIDREQAARCLSSLEGLTLLQAHDGREALRVLAGRPADLVLTDLR